MRQRSLPFVVGLITLASMVAEQGFAVSLGELQAIPGVSPPYIFRLAIHSRPDEPVDSPAVTVRQPSTALSLVKKNILELHLPSLADVELEVSHSGQTLNRLLLKSELQGARLRMEAATAWSRLVAAKANHLPRPQLVALLDAASQAYHAWAQLDPRAAQDGMAKVSQERQRFQMTYARQAHPSAEGSAASLGHLSEMPPPVLKTTKTSAGATVGAAVEYELWALRGEMSELVAQVAPWGGAVKTPAWFPPGGEMRELFAMFLAGGCLLGIVSVLVGYLLQHRLSEQALQRHRILRVIERQPPKALTRGQPELTLGQPHQALEGRHVGRQPTTMKRRLHVSLRMTRRMRLDSLDPHQEPILPPSIRLPAMALPRHPRLSTLTPSALLEALDRLRSDLVNLQRLSAPFPPEDFPTPRAGRHRS